MSKIKQKKKLNLNKTKTNNKKVVKKKVKFALNENEEKKFEDYSSNSSNESSEDGSDNELDSIIDHKKSLEKLKENDLEFYEYLRQNDKQLLDFDVSDEDLEEDNDDNDNNQLDEELEDSEISDKLSVKQIDEWSERLKEKADIDTIKVIIKWFRKAVNQTSGESDGHLISTESFNAIVNLCLIDLLPAIHKFLKLPQIGSKEGSNDVKPIDPSKTRNWKKVISIMKWYLTDVIKMLSVVSEPSLKATLLRHILHLIPFFITFPHLTKRVVKQIIVLWSESEEKNRILSFICILRITRTQEQSITNYILKKMYISFIKNSKFTNESNWGFINFMKHSLVELYTLDATIAYQHSFVFIRQLAINLRTAMTVKKKESYKCVYNWQYLHSILLWTQLLCSENTTDELKPLICPLVNVIIGTIRLIPSPKFFPIRFHLIKALIRLSDETKTFIPILPLITEVFDHFDKLKKNKSKEEKKMNFEILIKVSNLNLNDFEFRNSTINRVYDLILYYLSTHSHRIAFPELVQISTIKIRKFIKRSHVVQHNQLLKQLLEKIEENSKFINEKRKSITFGITDTLLINSLETQLKCDGTPIDIFYNQRKSLKSQKEMSETILEMNTNSIIEENLEEINFENNENKTIGVKRKHNEKQNTEKSKNFKKKKTSKKFKKRLSKDNKKTEIFNLDQSLDISSDEN